MTFLNKTRGLNAWSRLLHLAARRPGNSRASRAHVPAFGLLVPPHQER